MSDQKHHPPKAALRFLAWFCPEELHESIEGDLWEQFEQDLQKSADHSGWSDDYRISRARRRFVWNVIKFFRPSILLRNRFSVSFIHTVMFKNYFIIAFRNLLKQKLYSFINIGGLAVGLAGCILILLFVQHELSYDRFYENADRIYRIVQRQPGYVYLGSDHFAPTPAPLASTLVEEYPEVTSATTVKNQRILLSLDDQHYWENALWADMHFFEVFTFPLLRGDPETALAKPNSLVLTESLARKIFGDQDPMGQILMYQNQDPYTVTGVIADVPANSSLKFAFIMSIQSQSDYLYNLAEYRWSSNNWYTFFTQVDGTKVVQLQAKMPALVEKYVAHQGEDPNKRVQFLIQSLSDVHLRSHFNHDIAFTGDIKYVYLFAAIAFVILLLACVNYTNLAVARSIKRAHEVGMRKVIGARRGQLINQFLGESVLMTLLALLLALLLAHLLLPVFVHLVERPLQMDYTGNGLLLPGLLVLVVLVGLLSGSYPAFFMASLLPIQVLKGKMEGSASRLRVQRLLIVGQYTVSIALVAGSFVIYQQLQYVQHKELGYDREHVVTVQVNDEALRQNYQLIRQEWLSNNHITAVTSAGDLPTNIASSTRISGWEGSSEEDHLDIYRTSVDYDFLDVFGIELIAGRNFSREVASNETACLINETAARALGWAPEEAVGKHFIRNDEERTIVGVVKDFHMHSMHLPIQPLMIFLDTGGMQHISAKIHPDNLPETIAFLERTVKQFTPYPFEYQFLDQHFDLLYKAELRLGETFGYFTLLALMIASLGLFGLAAFTAEQRTKEIGIRKVMGASVRSIVTLLAKNFLRLIAMAFLFATPITYYFMNRWLEDFAYRIELEWWMFALADILAVLVAILTISFQSIKAAVANPVDSLRNE